MQTLFFEIERRKTLAAERGIEIIDLSTGLPFVGNVEAITSNVVYRNKLFLDEILTDAGMLPAQNLHIGSLTLWRTPTYAFGKKMGCAGDFNLVMIKNTGLVGFCFCPLIGYTATVDVAGFSSHIKVAFERAMISY